MPEKSFGEPAAHHRSLSLSLIQFHKSPCFSAEAIYAPIAIEGWYAANFEKGGKYKDCNTQIKSLVGFMNILQYNYTAGLLKVKNM